MTAADYFFDNGQSRKFWFYELRGKKQTLIHGRIGTKGRETSKVFASPSAAKAATKKLADQKIAKGYAVVNPDVLKIVRPKGKRAATKSRVAKLEKRLGTELPKEYRKFLLTQNGGTPEQDHVSVPRDSHQDSIPVGFLYGLYSKPEPYKSLLFAVEKILPCLPDGHLPICGLFNLHCYSIALYRNRGCVYYWNEDVGDYDVDEDGQPIFDDSHAILVAGSFNEFLTRIAIHKTPDENEESAITGTNAKNQYEHEIPELRSGKRLSKRRRKEIFQLVEEGGEELTAVMEQGEELMRKKSRKAGQALIDKFLRQMDRKIKEFLRTTTSKDELQYFAENWPWEANTRQLLELVKNPHIDAGTLLQIYWYGCPEDYYLYYKSASEIKDEFDRYVFRVLRHIERRIVKAEYKTASISFDPTVHISMNDRRAEFARQIPDAMYQPISGRKKRIG